MALEDNFISKIEEKLESLGNDYTLYAICDNAVDDKIIHELEKNMYEHATLFTKKFADVYEDIAPFLVQLDLKRDEHKAFIKKELASDSMSLLISSKHFESLGASISSFIIIFSEEHKQEIIFRFYDPRNIKRYFKLLESEDLNIFFDETQATFAYLDSKSKEDLNFYSLKDSALFCETINLKESNESSN